MPKMVGSQRTGNAVRSYYADDVLLVCEMVGDIFALGDHVTTLN